MVEVSEFKLHYGHVLDKLKLIESESVDCVITSPPYWGVRIRLWEAGQQVRLH